MPTSQPTPPPRPTGRLAARVVEVERATHDIRIVRLALDSGRRFDFRAGQYAKVGFPDCPPRDYSMANRPGAHVLEFHIREVSGGAASVHVVRSLKPGDAAEIEGPFGSSYLQEDHKGPIVAVAAATGLAPVTSIVVRALEIGLTQPIHVYFGVRDEPDIYLEGRFRRLAAAHPNLHFVPVLSDPRGPTERRVGLVGEVAAAEIDDLADAKLYLAGSPGMVEATVPLFTRRGVAVADIHADAFYNETDKPAPDISKR